MLELNKIYNKDCIGERGMALIADGSVDMVLCDLPYGTTACKWDTVLDFGKLWEQYNRVIKPNGAIVLFAGQPFTTALIASNYRMFKYCWVWDKKKPGGIGFAKYQPMRVTEDIVVFSKGSTKYFPIMIPRDKPKKSRNYKHSEMNHESLAAQSEDTVYTKKYPKNIIEISNANQKGKVHPTQKPVALFEYLIRTYTNHGDTVLDNCIGSGTTAVACINTNRNFIGFELDEKYFNIANERINKLIKNK